ncbi:hypothetical protein Tco_0687614 [Tanacetum coccineum]
MANLKFADTHNMVAFLSKPEESDEFEQIVDFLNAHPIKYALTFNPTIYISCIKQFWSTVKAKIINGEIQLHALVDGKKIIITESTVRRDLQLKDAKSSKTTAWNEFSSTTASAIICLATNQKFNFSKYIFEGMIRNLDNVSRKFLMYPRKDIQVPQPSDPSENVANEVVHKELGDSLVRAATTASSLEAEQDSGNITKTRSKATLNESSSLGTTLGGGPRCQETMRDTIAQTRFENVSKYSNDSLLARGNTKTKTTQKNEIDSLKMRVKKLEKKRSSRTHKLKRLYKFGLTTKVESSGDKEDLDDADNEMFDVNVLNGEEVFVAGQNENVVEEVVDAAQVSKSTTTTIISSQQSHDKGKRIMIEEPVKPMKKKDQISFDEEVALKLQAEFDEEERLAREKAKKEKEANIALIETWDDIQAKINADYQLAERLQAPEQEELSDVKKATLFQQLLEKRRKHFAAKRAEEKRNKPPTKAQQKKIMCTYLKNMEGYKLNDLKLKDFHSIQEMFDRTFKRVNTLEDFRTELVEGKEKRVGAELEQESTKK